ncbi:hypothetical protein DFH09DRAFT_1090309 [Mycena vulgaris]|nr:hypothetical protein DFH09DRAFT_1090309 [Mycena vulgaris]
MSFPADKPPPPPPVIIAKLAEIQTAEVGRKCGTVDRRPLDPHQLFLVTHAGTPFETESEIVNYENINSLGFICKAEMFPFVPYSTEGRVSGQLDSVVLTAFNLRSFLEPTRQYPGAVPNIPHQLNSSDYTNDLAGSTSVQTTTIQHHDKESLVFAFTGSVEFPLVKKNRAELIMHAGSIFKNCGKFHSQPTLEILLRALQFFLSFQIFQSLADSGIHVNVRDGTREGRRKRKSGPSEFEPELNADVFV